MVGPPHVVQPWMPRAARAAKACVSTSSCVGGARRRGCAAGGVSEFFNGLLGGLDFGAVLRPAGVEGAFLVHAPVGVGAEEVALALDQVRGTALAPVAVVVGQRGRERGD